MLSYPHRRGLKPPYQIVVPRRRGKADTRPVLPGTLPKEIEQVGPIQGKDPDSIQEWRLATGLYAEELTFQYQVWLWGGSLISGGYILDFLVFGTRLAPFPIAVPLQGSFWHDASHDPDRKLDIARLEQEYGVGHVIEVMAEEIGSVDEARAWIRSNLK